MIEPRKSKKRVESYRVKRLEGRLTATFYTREAAQLQDSLWGRWGAEIPALADQKPRVSATLLGSILDKQANELSPILLAQLVAAHPVRLEAVVVDGEGPLLGEYIEKFFEMWKDGKIPGRKKKPHSTK